MKQTTAAAFDCLSQETPQRTNEQRVGDINVSKVP